MISPYLKLEDLFIGAWVYNDHHKKNIQITPYDFFTHRHDENGVQHLKHHSIPRTGSDLYPIPLTFEFMTKNFPTSDIVFWNPGAMDNNHCFYCEVGYDDSKRNISGDFYYVHELQHALRLCGINKEIEL